MRGSGVQVKGMELGCGLLQRETLIWGNGEKELSKDKEFIKPAKV